MKKGDAWLGIASKFQETSESRNSTVILQSESRNNFAIEPYVTISNLHRYFRLNSINTSIFTSSVDISGLHRYSHQRQETASIFKATVGIAISTDIETVPSNGNKQP